jgi:hypothetical protein
MPERRQVCFARSGDPAELIDVEVHELAGTSVLVVHPWAGEIEASEAAEAT